MPDQPNVIFIITDQQRVDTIAAAGCDWMITPNIDRLTGDGILFNRAYCCGATCISSRAALFTGMYAHNTGVYSFNRWAHHPTWLEDFRGADYHVVNVGKMHHAPAEAPGAFHERFIVENKAGRLACDIWNRFLHFSGYDKPNRQRLTVPDWPKHLNSMEWPMPENLHCDAFVGDLAVDYIRRWDKRKPLFLQIGFPGPHEPYDPPKRFLDLYRNRPTPPRIFQEGDLANKPPEHQLFRDFFQNTSFESIIDFDGASDEAVAMMRRHYYANVTLIDEKLGQILDALQEKGMLDESIIIFTSDHGDCLGDHDLPYKWTMYEPVVNIPMIVRTSRTAGRGWVDDALFSQIDYGPTLLEMCGIDIPSRLDGQARTKRFTQPDSGDVPQAVFCQDNYLTMARTDDWKLVHYAGTDHGELYDLAADRQELANLYHAPAAAEKLHQMRDILLEWFAPHSLYFNGGYKNHNGDSQYQMRHGKLYR